jgi:hypothetical protein
MKKYERTYQWYRVYVGNEKGYLKIGGMRPASAASTSEHIALPRRARKLENKYGAYLILVCWRIDVWARVGKTGGNANACTIAKTSVYGWLLRNRRLPGI